MIKEIVARIDVLNDLMKDLLLFSRPPVPRPQPVELVSLVTATAGLLAEDPSLRGVSVDVVGSAPPIDADAGMLKIIFQNLLVNSAQAMDGRGRIRVTVDAADGHVGSDLRTRDPEFLPCAGKKSSRRSSPRKPAVPAWVFPPRSD